MIVFVRYELNKDVRISLYDACDKWTRAVKKTPGVFMGGDEPDLSELVNITFIHRVCVK